MKLHEADVVLYWTRNCWRIYNMRRGTDTYHDHVRFVGEACTYYEPDGISILPGKPDKVILVKGQVLTDEQTG